MSEALELLKINATNGKENFCYINEKQLKALKELAKRYEKEIDVLNKELDKIRLSELHKEYVISELEKWLDKEIKKEKAFCSRRYTEEGIVNSLAIEGTFEQVLNKLKELKEQNNEKDM